MIQTKVGERFLDGLVDAEQARGDQEQEDGDAKELERAGEDLASQDCTKRRNREQVECGIPELAGLLVDEEADDDERGSHRSGSGDHEHVERKREVVPFTKPVRVHRRRRQSRRHGNDGGCNRCLPDGYSSLA